MEYQLVTTEWEVRYPIEAEPIGIIRRVVRRGQPDWFRVDGLGAFPDGDSAAVAVWESYLARHRVQHEHASRTHGGANRHPNDRTRPRSPGEG